MPKSSTRSGPGAPRLAANVAELRALAHPLRLRILELFAEQPRTTKQVADLLGEPPTRLYHHVAALERAGLVELRETRKNRGTVEKWYETPARMLGAGTHKPLKGGARGAEAKARRAAALAVVDQSRQEMLQALAQTRGEPPLVGRLVIVVASSKIPAVRARLLEMIEQLRREYDRDGDPPGDDIDRWAMTLAFAPVTTSTARRA